MEQMTTIRESHESDITIADSLYLLCKTMTFPLLMPFDKLIKMPLDELIDILEVFQLENTKSRKEGLVKYENGNRIIEKVGMRRH